MRKGFYWKLAAGNIRKNRKIYYPYLLTAVLTAMMLYVISSLSSNQSLGSGNLLITLQLGKLVTTLFAGIFLFYTNSFLMKRRKKEFGLLNILGMGKKHIALVIFCETLILLLVSLVLGIGLGILFDKLMFLLLMKLLGAAVSGLSFQILPGVVASTALIISVIFLLILLNSIRQIHLAKPIELLRGGEVGELEPKANWLLAVLGSLFLGAGYYISIAVTDAVTSILLFFVAVICVILGTYLLFTAGSVTRQQRGRLPLPLRRQRHPAEAFAEGQALLLRQARSFHQRLRHDLPHEAKRGGAGQRGHSVHHGAGDRLHHDLYVFRLRGVAEA